MNVTLTASALLGLALVNCTSWQRDDAVLSAPVPRREAVEVWSHGHSLAAHGLEVRGDSLRAVPRWKAPDCDSCAHWFALRAVDSVRVRRVSAMRTLLLLGIVGAFVYMGSQLPSGT